VLRYAAFTDDPRGGNPAGLVLDARGLDERQMQAIAADVGYSESAFLVASGEDRSYDVRYFSPEAEVPFCGHATVATAVALAERDGPGELRFRTAAGEVPVLTRTTSDGAISATLTTVAPAFRPLAPEDLDRALALLRWQRDELDPALPPALAYAGLWHLVIAAGSRERLAALDYDFEGMKAFMLERELTTVDLVWREDETTFHARNPFPVGGVVEDPATGAAAAALGAYLRDAGALELPASVTVRQGEDMGRPSTLTVDVSAEQPGIRVSGRAVPIAGA
jgi:PhzF family phenazine biosynthesis protein